MTYHGSPKRTCWPLYSWSICMRRCDVRYVLIRPSDNHYMTCMMYGNMMDEQCLWHVRMWWMNEYAYIRIWWTYIVNRYIWSWYILHMNKSYWKWVTDMQSITQSFTETPQYECVTNATRMCGNVCFRCHCFTITHVMTCMFYNNNTYMICTDATTCVRSVVWWMKNKTNKRYSCLCIYISVCTNIP
jgi:hypothetical protein